MLDADAIDGMTVRDLLATHEAVLTALRSMGVVRTGDAPSAQYAEWLALQAFGGALETNSTKGYDLLTADARRMQVRCCVIRSGDASERQLSPFRSADFDDALIILFDPTYDVVRAAVLSAEQVLRLARWQPHVNGRVLIARDAVLSLGVDVKKRLRAARPSPPHVARSAPTSREPQPAATAASTVFPASLRPQP